MKKYFILLINNLIKKQNIVLEFYEHFMNISLYSFEVQNIMKYLPSKYCENKKNNGM